MTEDQPRSPTLRVASGSASAEELAAVLAVIGRRSGAGSRRASAAGPRAGSDEPGQGAGWSDRARALRSTLPHGPGAWRDSGRAAR